MTVAEYCQEEVERQGHDIYTLDGIERIAWLMEAWAYAIEESAEYARPSLSHAVTIGKIVEREKNRRGLRRVGVRVGMRVCPHPNEVRHRLERLFALPPEEPLDFYRAFEEIHPFVDGNGRTGKVLLNWLNGTLLRPIFPPADFWGQPICNP